MPGIDVRMMSYGDRVPTQDRYNSEESLEDNQSTTSSTESRQSDFMKKEHEFIPTRSSGILASKPAANPGQFTRINSNPLLISAQKQMLLVEEVKKKKEVVKVGEDIPDWQSNLDGWKMRRRKQSEETIGRVEDLKRVTDPEAEALGWRKSSLGKKISLQIENNDEINFDDFGDDDEEEKEEDKKPGVYTPRRESRGVSQEKVIIEEDEEEEDHKTDRVIKVINGWDEKKDANNDEEDYEEDEETEDEEIEETEDEEVEDCNNDEEDKEEMNKPIRVTKVSDPYESAIEGYKSFALSHQSVPLPSAFSSSSKESSPSSSFSHSSVTSSLSSSSPPRKPETKKKEEEWEEKIETFVQPARRASTEVSEKMKQKMASFTGVTGKEKEASPPVRSIKPDNKFQDKLKAFKTIETAAVKEITPSPVTNRRESEPILSRPRVSVPQPKTSITSSISSSSFMNTIQNAKFFQQNSLGSEEPEDEEEDNQAMEDALEESFNVLEEGKYETEKVVFSADDFIPTAGKIAPPQEKPPPLPPGPPPPLPEMTEEETDIDKQEREIIESLEREEQEHKQYLETLTTTTITSSSFSSSFSSSSSTSSTTGDEKSSVSTQSTQSSLSSSKSWGSGAGAGVGTGSGIGTATVAESGTGSEVGSGLRNGESQVSTLQPKKKEKDTRDYSKHWLIQEAEQRRIAEANQKQNLNLNNHSSSNSSGIDKIENINNNNNSEYKGHNGEKRREHNVSDNIYANVDAGSMTFNKNHSQFSPQVSDTGSATAQIPGPQVPPRLGESGERQDRVLSVSGKKKCSHCKEELGRGAAMIIESLRLFYHIRCFKCCVCSIQLGNGEQGTDVRVRNNRLHCHNCYSNDEGLKFSKV